ncbi:MAG: Helicase associated domain protein, partial [bacterium]
VGRAIRKSPGKELGTIVLPVFVRPGDDARAMVEASDFRDVWGVIAALRAQDPGLGAELDAIRTRMGREPDYRPTTQDLSRIVIDVPLSVGFEVADAIRTAVVEQGTDTWEFWFGLLEAYVAGNGHCLVPANHVTSDGSRLGQWVNSQRSRRTTMPANRKSRLEALPGWTWGSQETQWKEGFARLEAYVADMGDCRVTQSYVTGDGYQLGTWLNSQRSKRTTMPADRKRRLEALPGWTWGAKETQWDEGFARLEAYVADTGDCRATQRYVTGDGYRLGTWVNKQRSKRTTMPADRKRHLEALPGWTWEPFESQWEEGFARLEAYMADKGDCRVPKDHVTGGGYQLGRFVNKQRSKRDTMPADRRARLEALPGWTWNMIETQWEEGFSRLEAYVSDKGNCRVPNHSKYIVGYQLGAWVAGQRTTRTTMSAERKSRLEALPGWTWDARDEKWGEGFARLEAYVAENGHCRVPQDYVTGNGSRLGTWVNSQRQTRTTMPADRKSRLEALPGWTWGAKETQWEEGFARLEAYVAGKGGCRVPNDHVTSYGYRLGGWVAQQRTMRTTMPADRKRRLEALPGWTWDARPAPRGAVKNAEDDGGTS